MGGRIKKDWDNLFPVTQKETSFELLYRLIFGNRRADGEDYKDLDELYREEDPQPSDNISFSKNS